MSLFEHVQKLADRLLGEAREQPWAQAAPSPRAAPASERGRSKLQMRIAEWQRHRKAMPDKDPMLELERSPYAALVRQQLEQHGIKVRRWRSSMSGLAWNIRYVRGPRAGQEERWLESPLPRTELSLSIFLHEVGHHAIGFRTYKPRCLEEFKAWEWSLSEMKRCGVEVTPVVTRRVQLSLWYAVRKGKRRGLRRVPAELVDFEQAPVHVSKRRLVPREPGADLWT